MYIENTPEGFQMTELPVEAQLSSINAVQVDDFDNDGALDALIAGNLHSSEVETPRNDASIGLFLKGDGAGGFRPVLASESGFYVPGDVKNLLRITKGGVDYLLVGKNNDSLQLVKLTGGKQEMLVNRGR